MSIEAMKWAMEQAIVINPNDRHVLLIMANSARADGTAAFQAVAKIAKVTGLSDRTVQRCIARLIDIGAIRPGNDAVRDAHISRADRRPNTYDIAIERGVTMSPGKATGCHSRQNGVTAVQERGVTVSPDPNITPTDPIGVYSAPDLRPEVIVCQALRPRGQPITPSNPELVAAIADGITAETIIEAAKAYPDKPASYAIAVCRREHATPASTIRPGDSHANRHRGRKVSIVEQTEVGLREFLAEHGA